MNHTSNSSSVVGTFSWSISSSLASSSCKIKKAVRTNIYIVVEMNFLLLFMSKCCWEVIAPLPHWLPGPTALETDLDQWDELAVGTKDKRTDVWSRDFIIWKINSGLWAVVWAGLWNKRVWADYDQLLRPVFSLFLSQKFFFNSFEYTIASALKNCIIQKNFDPEKVKKPFF